jgi:chemotaxis methyl-accepting protein methylase
LLADFGEKAKHGGAVVLGSNERMPADGWSRSGDESVSVYVKGA